MSKFSKRAEVVIERLIFRSRWLVLPFYFGLMVSLAAYAYAFCREVFYLIFNVNTKETGDVLILMLTLVDKVLIANLIVMVTIGGYENSVSRLDINSTERSLSWLGKLDASSLKAKLATAVVSIAFVKLLLIFIDVKEFSDREIYASVGIFVVMLLGATVVSILDKWGRSIKSKISE